MGEHSAWKWVSLALFKKSKIAAYRQTLLFNGQVLPNEAIAFNTDKSEPSRVQFFLDADSGNHVAPPTLSPAPNSNEDDHEITDMHIPPGGDELEEMLRWNPDAPPPPPPDKKENLEMPQSIVDIPPPKEELLSSIPDAPQVAPQTPMTVTENALPPRI